MSTEKILVVDDDPGFCGMLTRFLTDEGYKAEFALGGEEGLVKIEKEFYDIVILDIKMPRVSGLDVLRKIKSIEKYANETCVIVITGYISNNTPIEALKLGATDYIVKPFELDEFLRSVERNIKIIRLRKERDAYYKQLAETNEQYKNTIKELEETRNKLLLSEKMAAIGQLASMIGHEIRNPLESIENNAFLIEKSLAPKDDKTRKQFSSLQKGINDAIEIVEELLNFSKEKQLSIETVSIDKIIAETLDTIKCPPRIVIKKQIAPNAESIQADQHRLRQILTNLITNAIQSMPDSIGVINISTKADGDNVRIIVADTGCGMNEDKIRNLFNPFFTTKPKGIGLGMIVVREIVEKHHGSIRVESQEGSGTTFYITLPKTQPAAV